MITPAVINVGWTLCRPNVSVIKKNRQKEAAFPRNIGYKMKPGQ